MMDIFLLFHLICFKPRFYEFSVSVQMCHSVTKVSLFVAGVIVSLIAFENNANIDQVSIGEPEVVASVLRFLYFSMFPFFTVIVKDQYPVNNTLVNIHSSSQMCNIQEIRFSLMRFDSGEAPLEIIPQGWYYIPFSF